MPESTEKLRRLADAAEACDHNAGPDAARSKLTSRALALARLLADEHEALVRAIKKFEAFTTSDIETTFKAEAHRTIAATDVALAALEEEPW